MPKINPIILETRIKNTLGFNFSNLIYFLIFFLIFVVWVTLFFLQKSCLVPFFLGINDSFQKCVVENCVRRWG